MEAPHRRFVDSLGVPIEVLRWDPEPSQNRSRPSVVLVPGMLDHASYWPDEVPELLRSLEAGTERHVVAISLRGRGASGCPERGWGVSDHVRDITSVFAAEKIDAAFLVGWSVGGFYASAFALAHPSQVLGLIVGDYPPVLPGFSEAWRRSANGLREELGFAAELPERIVRESSRVSLVEDLDQLGKPILVLRGTKADALLAREESAEAWSAVRSAKTRDIDTGHEVFAHPDGQEACVEFVSRRRGSVPRSTHPAG